MVAVASPPWAGTRWFARIGPPLAATAVVATAGLHWLARSGGVDTWWAGSVFIGVSLGAMGTLLVRRVPDNPIGHLMLLGGLAQASMGANREWSVYATLVHPGLPGAAWAAWLGSWAFAVSMSTFPLVLLVFPDGHLLSDRWRIAVRAIVAAVVVSCIAQAIRPGPFTDEMPTVRNPIGIHLPLLDAVTTVAEVVIAVALVAALWSLMSRRRRSVGEERQRLRVVGFGAVLLGLELLFELVPMPLPDGYLTWLGPAMLLVFLGCVTAAVLRYRLWDIDSLISFSVIYGTLTIVLGGAYVGVVASAGQLRGHPVEIGSSLVAAAVVAVAFAPLRDRLQRLLDRKLYGDRSDPYRALTRLGDRLEGPVTQPVDVPGTPQDAVLDEVVEAVAASLRLASVDITSPEGLVLASTGAARGQAHELPLLFRSSVVGKLVVSPRPGATIGARELNVLNGLAPPAAAVVHAVAVSEALQRSREAVVTTREEERRRVRRDLHDGLGPALAGVSMKLDGAQLLVERDPAAVKVLLQGLADDIRTTIVDIRRLVYDLRPPALDELGLVSALAEQAAAFTGPTEGGGCLDVTVDAPHDLGRLPAAIEVAVYRIATEAMTNVVRHARASRCRIALGVGAGLHLLVDDDGVGLSDDDRRGVGVRSMIERADELGGSCRFERSPLGGTRVSALLPLPEPAPVTSPDLPSGFVDGPPTVIA